jgi:membrane protease YdiL (CAAX protease family)
MARSSATARIFLSDDGRLRPAWRALWFILLVIVVFVVFGPLIGFPENWQEHKFQVTAIYTLQDGVLIALSWFMLRTHGQSFRALGLWFYSGWHRDLGLGVLIGAVMMAIVVGAMAAANLLQYGGHSEGCNGLWLVELGFLLFLAAAAEELAFRGYGFQRLIESVGPVWATVIFSALFGFAHRGNPAATPLSTASTVLVGILFSVAYLRTRALWLPIGLHWAWNFVQGPIFSLPVSGVTFPGELLRANISGVWWLTGGAYGPEGGAISIVVYGLAILWLWRWRGIRISPEMQEALK